MKKARFLVFNVASEHDHFNHHTSATELATWEYGHLESRLGGGDLRENGENIIGDNGMPVEFVASVPESTTVPKWSLSHA